MLRVKTRLPASSGKGTTFDIVVLAADERRVRRKLIKLQHGDEVLVDFAEPVTLEDRDLLELEDGRLVEVMAAEEQVYEITGRDTEHLMRLAWHLGNRHLPAQIEEGRILIRRDHVIRDMLIGLGASVLEKSESFHPEHGAYHGHNHGGQGEDHALLYRR